MTIVTEAVNQYIKQQQKEWVHDRRQTIGASEIGQCARKIFCLKFEDDPHLRVPRNAGYVDSWGARERGNLIEKHLLVPAMKKNFGQYAMFMGNEQKTFFDGYLSATPDCILEMHDQPKVYYQLIEFKTIDPRVDLREAKPEHVYQAQMQMGILAALGEYQPCERAIISYTDASFLNDTMEFTVIYDPSYYEAARNRAHMIMTAEGMREIAPEGWIAGGKECAYCPFSDACGYSRRDVPKDNIGKADPQFVAEISDLAKQYKLAQALSEKYESNVRELQHDIKTRLQDKHLRSVVGDGVSVSWTQIKGRMNTDVKGLREAAQQAGIDLDQFTSTADPSDRLTVTIKSSS